MASTADGPFRDGKVHILAEQCSTCIFRPGNLMHLEPGRVRDMVQAALRDDAAITCHQTLDYGIYDAPPAVCNGFHTKYSTYPLRLAELLGLLEYDPPPKHSKLSDD